MSSQNAVAWAQEQEHRQVTDPIEIPAVGPGRARPGERAGSHRDEDHAGDDGGVVPPHVLVARRGAAFSVCSGQGRTLKGRDLRRVRDSVLRMTGFIET